MGKPEFQSRWDYLELSLTVITTVLHFSPTNTETKEEIAQLIWRLSAVSPMKDYEYYLRVVGGCGKVLSTNMWMLT